MHSGLLKTFPSADFGIHIKRKTNSQDNSICVAAVPPSAHS